MKLLIENFKSFINEQETRLPQIYCDMDGVFVDFERGIVDQINKDLSETMGSALKFDYKVDKELIGGLKLQLGSIMIDTSIRNKLKKYEQAMLEN